MLYVHIYIWFTIFILLEVKLEMFELEFRIYIVRSSNKRQTCAIAIANFAMLNNF
jgi:hypothetical protein